MFANWDSVQFSGCSECWSYKKPVQVKDELRQTCEDPFKSCSKATELPYGQHFGMRGPFSVFVFKLTDKEVMNKYDKKPKNKITRIVSIVLDRQQNYWMPCDL